MTLDSDTDYLSVIIQALEASLYHAPQSPGLSRAELHQIAAVCGGGKGKMNDVLNSLARDERFREERGVFSLVPGSIWPFTMFALGPMEPDYRNFPAMDVVVGDLKQKEIDEGKDDAFTTRAELVNKGIAAGFSAEVMEASIGLLVFGGALTEKDGVIRFAVDRPKRDLPSTLAKQGSVRNQSPRPMMKKIYEQVGTIIARRSGGTGASPQAVGGQQAPLAKGTTAGSGGTTHAMGSKTVFLVHGHGHQWHEVEAFLRKLKLDVIVLKDEPSGGKTLIEKFEANAEKAIYAVVVLTPDDLGAAKADAVDPKNLKPRARQNAIFELGYFVARLKRKGVCALQVSGLENPGDYDGVVYVELDDAGAWKQKLARELHEANVQFDAHDAL
jgi:predicted nucleotide-binding protein